MSESALTGVRASHVLNDGAAERAGICAGDELIAIGGWRLRRIDDALRLLKPGTPTPLLVSRDQRVLTLPLALPKDTEVPGNVSLAVETRSSRAATGLRKAWMTG